MNTVHELDTRGLNCPLPILKLKKMINDLNSGNEIHLIATDPGSVKDVASFCKQTGHDLISSDQGDSEFLFTIKVS